MIADDLAAAIVRAWTRAYTVRLAPNVREARRAEIGSDLWEHTHAARDAAADPRSVAGQILARCLLGIPADLIWRSQMASGRGRLVDEGVSMSDRIKRNWWVPGLVVLVGLSALMVLIHIVGDGFESAWTRTTSGWNPSLLERAGTVALLAFIFVVLPIWAFIVRDRHPGWTVVLLLPLELFSLIPMMWGDAGWLTLISVLGLTILIGSIVNLAQRSVEEEPALSSPVPQHTRR